MRFLVALLALTLPAFAQIRYSPTGFTAPFISTVTNQASAQAYLGISGGGGGSVTNFGGSATNLQVYSSGGTNEPLRAFGTNGAIFKITKDGQIINNSGPTVPGLGAFIGDTVGSGLEIIGGTLFGLYSGSYFFTLNQGGAGGMILPNYGRFGLSSGASASTGTMDVALSRTDANGMQINNGTAGTYRDLVTRSTFATNASITNITADSYVTTQQTLSYASATNLTVDANKSLHFVSLTNTAYFAQPSNLEVGRTFTVILQQDGTGTRAVTFNTNYWKFPGGVVPTITTNANAYDVLSCISCPYGTNVFAIHNAKFQ